MKAVVTVIGKDMVGILAKVSTACAEKNTNVLEVTQSILEGYFCMLSLPRKTRYMVRPKTITRNNRLKTVCFLLIILFSF